jgi:peptide/nickel transport system substrate-binding protein
MSELDYLQQQHIAGRISRRELMGRAAALGAGAALIGTMLEGVDAHAATTPNSGGTLKLGMAGGSTTDSLNPTTWTDTVNVDVGAAVYNALVQVTADNKPIPELAESWEAKPGATEWVLNLRKGVTFHNGKTFDADDAIYSINLHRGPKTTSGAAALYAEIADVKKLTPNQIQVTLKSGDADFPTVLTDYHAKIVPNGTTDFSKGPGTGGYIIEQYQAGVRATGKRNPNYWKQGKAHVDSFDVTVINDLAARMNALVSGQVDVVNRVDPKQAPLIRRRRGLELVVAPGGWFTLVSMTRDTSPFNNPDLRKAMQYALDREQIVKTLFSGFGSVGNDHPISRSDAMCNTQLPQLTYDPDKARALAKKSGFDGTIVIDASDAAFGGAIDMAQLIQQTAGKAGIKVQVKADPADGFWENIWLKRPAVTSYWAGRTAASQMLSVAFSSSAVWNESHYNSPKFDQTLAAAKAELDDAKRKQLLWDCQALLHDDAAAMIPAFKNWIDAHSTKVGGHTPYALFDLDGGYIVETAWLKKA